VSAYIYSLSSTFSSECCDLFFPILPTFAFYILGNPDEHDNGSRPADSSTVRIPVGVEFPVDVHLRNSMILQTYPHYLYFSALRPISLSISSYDEFRWIQEHQDYSRLKQRCRQKFLQETVTKTLVVKGSLVLTDLTDEVMRAGTSAVGYGGFSDVWKGVWNDPVEKRPRNVRTRGFFYSCLLAADAHRTRLRSRFFGKSWSRTSRRN
jgi:hypothetical protein